MCAHPASDRPGYANDPYESGEGIPDSGTTTKIPSLSDYDEWTIYTDDTTNRDPK